jgi:F1F0 ATPase subunit 2
MAMNETLPLILAGAAGLAIGAAFFGGLLWTVRMALSSPRPALWIFTSLLVRVGLALAVFYIVSGSHWQRLLACLLGFAGARLLVTHLSRGPTGPRAASSPATPAKVRHAP